MIHRILLTWAVVAGPWMTAWATERVARPWCGSGTVADTGGR